MTLSHAMRSHDCCAIERPENETRQLKGDPLRNLKPIEFTE